MAKNECINLRISKKEKEKLRKCAEEKDMNMTEYILECICLRDEKNVVRDCPTAPETGILHHE